VRGSYGGSEAGEASEHGNALALVLRGIVRSRVVGPRFRRGRGFVHAVARHRIVWGAVLWFGDSLFLRDQPRAMRRRRFHPSGKDEGYGKREANADQPLDHAPRMALIANLSI
jgi:hypothetical protein